MSDGIWRCSVVSAAAFIGACAASPTLRQDRYDDIHFGMRLTEAEAKFGKAHVYDDPDTGCYMVGFKRLPDVTFMVESGIITRADVGRRTKTALGIRIGDSARKVERRFPDARIEPHKYYDEGHYYAIGPRDGATEFVLEENEGRIVAIRAGVKPSVEYVEGCL